MDSSYYILRGILCVVVGVILIVKAVTRKSD